VSSCVNAVSFRVFWCHTSRTGSSRRRGKPLYSNRARNFICKNPVPVRIFNQILDSGARGARWVAESRGPMNTKNRLRNLYSRLPIVRELRQIRDAVLDTRADVHRIASKELLDFRQFAVMREPRYGDPKRLLRYAHQTFSQNDEDGMIAEICRRIGAPSRTFVEIGVGDGLENNSTALLAEGWRGWWVEADHSAMVAIASRFRDPIASGQLVVLEATVTAENIATVLQRLGVVAEFDVLSLDIDRNTYWVWAAMIACKPRVAVIEYNATFPPEVDWKVEYRPLAYWNKTSYFGASLKALELLGRKLGYSLVGCDFMGVNAFFVRTDLCGDKFAEPFTAENHYEPPRYGLIARQAHPAGFSDY